ncbi:hypothetical protein AGMMS49991_04380 [Spirochaetia bacterium]|nr:hypothetical protein AGMMS49991_04380 [Spirochaetia bacterium]
MTTANNRTYSHCMRTIAFIGIFVISLCLLFTPIPACSQPLTLGNTRFIISTEAAFGLMYGEGEEILYGAPNGAPYLSQLLWDMKPLLYVGSALSLAVKNPSWPVGIYTSVTVKAGIPGNTGSMEDRDWLDDDNQYLTHYSIHDNNTTGAFLLDYDLGVSIPIRFKQAYTMDLTVFGRLSWMQMEWFSQGGYTQYGENNHQYPPFVEWDAGFPKASISGPAISYRQMWLIAGPGLILDFPVWKLFSVSISFTVSPFIWGAAVDNHLRPDKFKQYNDYPRWGISLEPQMEFAYSPDDRFSLSVYVSYRLISGAKGDTYQDNNPSLRSANAIGAGYHALDTGLSLKISF